MFNNTVKILKNQIRELEIALNKERELIYYYECIYEADRRTMEDLNSKLITQCDYQKNCELLFTVLAQFSNSWLFGFSCLVEVIPYGGGVEFVLRPAFSSDKFPEIRYFAYRNDCNIETRTEIQQLSNKTISDVLVRLLTKTFPKRIVFNNEKEISVYGLEPNQIKTVREIYTTACSKYSAAIDAVIGEQKKET